MIEWWHALLIALAGGALPTAAALAVERMRHGHSLIMQERRLQAERQEKREEFAREVRRERLQPVFDLLTEMELGYSHRLWTAALDGIGIEGMVDRAVEGMAASPEIRAQVLKEMKELIPPSPVDLVARAPTVILRIDDDKIRQDLFLLALGLFGSGPDDAQLKKVANVHARLERYIADI